MKNDAAGAEAIVEAAQRPEISFVDPTAGRYRVRERLVCQRTELVNAIRSYLCEFGHTFPQGTAHLKRIETLIDDPNSKLPELDCNECRDLLIQLSEISERIDIKTWRFKDLATETDTARRLQTMPQGRPNSSAGGSGVCTMHDELQTRQKLLALSVATTGRPAQFALHRPDIRNAVRP